MGVSVTGYAADGVAWADRVRLGLALRTRASEVAATVLGRVGHRSGSAFGNCRLATDALGGWLAGGAAATDQEDRVLAANGRACADGVITVADLTKNYLTWRDAASEVLVEEAARLGVGAAVLGFALERARVSCDASLVRMARQHDCQRAQMEGQLTAERLALRHQGLHDGLTGMANRALLLDRVARALARGGRLAVLWLDLDGFKAVNDGLGREAGDELLVAVGARLSGLVRFGDTVARPGGDEFVIVCDGLDGQRSADGFAERVQRALAGPFTVRGQPLLISASVGVALGAGQGDPEVLLAQADSAMRGAKHRGPGRCQVYDGPAQQRTVRAAALRRALPWALSRGELQLHYQPVVALDDRRVVGVEALVRWTHPQLGVISPVEFIPVAEESGLIGSIGGWVLATACRQTARWRSGEHPDIGVAVNVSVRQLQDSSLIDAVRVVLGESGLPAHALTLEITESGLMGEPEQAVSVLTGLKELGVRLAIDDFGTGYSSLAYLRRLPVDILKIDRLFVSALGSAQGGQAGTILGAVVTLGHDLGLAVIAEGVQTPTELAQLRLLGCDLAQGYLLGRPGPPKAVAFDRYQALPAALPAPRAGSARAGAVRR